MKKKVLIFFVVLQLAVIGYLGTVIVKKKTSVLGEYNVNYIRKEDVVMPKESKVKNYYEPVPNLSTKELPGVPFYKGEYRINKDGLRDDKNYSEEKDKNTFRIVTMGDSFTYGLFVAVEDSWPKKLENSLAKLGTCSKKIEILNIAVPGHDIDYSIERYKRKGQKYNPDVVMWLLKDDDFLEVSDIIMQYQADFKKNRSKEELQKFLSKDYAFLWRESTTLMYRYIQQKGLESKVYNDKIDALTSFAQSQSDRPVLFFYYPSLKNNYKNSLQGVKDNLSNVYVSQDIIDVLSDKYINDLTYNKLGDIHPNADGYNAMANDLTTYLINNHLVPCEK